MAAFDLIRVQFTLIFIKSNFYTYYFQTFANFFSASNNKDDYTLAHFLRKRGQKGFGFAACIFSKDLNSIIYINFGYKNLYFNRWTGRKLLSQ